MDASFADAAHRAGHWLTCRPGCTQCCHGAFAINALDVARLQAGIETLAASHPQAATQVRKRAQTWIADYGANFPGDPATGTLGTSIEDQARFEEYANDAPCPALNPDTGLCDLYEWRPMTCRVFGPPVRLADSQSLGCCELCFIGANDDEIAACEMQTPHEMEERILEEIGPPNSTIVAFALLPQK